MTISLNMNTWGTLFEKFTFHSILIFFLIQYSFLTEHNPANSGVVWRGMGTGEQGVWPGRSILHPGLWCGPQWCRGHPQGKLRGEGSEIQVDFSEQGSCGTILHFSCLLLMECMVCFIAWQDGGRSSELTPGPVSSLSNIPSSINTPNKAFVATDR